MKKEFDPEDVKDLDFHVRVSFPKGRYFQKLWKFVYKNPPYRVKASNLRDYRKKRKFLAKCTAYVILRQRCMNNFILWYDLFVRNQVKAMEG